MKPLLISAAIAMTLSAGSANASNEHNYIVSPGVHDAGSIVILDTVRAARVGYVEIVDYRLGDLGEVLGSSKIRAGANTDVKVHVGMPLHGNVMAVLYDANGNMVASRKVDVD